jgi:hypothetical protein
LMLAFPSAFILRSESHGTCIQIWPSPIGDFPTCCHLRLAGLWWRYLTPPPHGGVVFSLALLIFILSEVQI